LPDKQSRAPSADRHPLLDDETGDLRPYEPAALVYCPFRQAGSRGTNGSACSTWPTLKWKRCGFAGEPFADNSTAYVFVVRRPDR
jgi:hypothetical protein